MNPDVTEVGFPLGRGAGVEGAVGEGVGVDVDAGAAVGVDAGVAVGGSRGVLVGAVVIGTRSEIGDVTSPSQASTDPTASRFTRLNQAKSRRGDFANLPLTKVILTDTLFPVSEPTFVLRRTARNAIDISDSGINGRILVECGPTSNIGLAG